MRVICIDASPNPERASINHLMPRLIEGAEYTASQCPVYKRNYQLSELSIALDGNPCSFSKRRFIPLSNIDELELVNKKEEVV